MSRSAIAALAALVLLVVAVPAAIAVLGGDDEPARPELAGGEGIDADSVPPEEAGDGQHPPRREEPARGAERGRGKGERGRGGPPQHARAFDRRMEGVGYPAAITRAGAPAVLAVERAAGAEVGAGQQTVIAADCRRGVCSVRYRTAPRGTGRVLETQQRILRTLFADPDVRRVVLYVHHKTVGRRKEERPAFIVVSCARRPGIVWSRVTARQVANHCDVTSNAGGRLRSSLRRGRVSVDGASTGSSPTGGGGAGGRQGGDAPPGAKPAGTPAPEKVKPKPEKPE